MTEESPCRCVGISDWLKKQGTWFWAGAITLVSVFVLFVGSQIARDTGQSVEWYTGFGQWLGGIGSIIAAGVALRIATEDRRHTDKREEAAAALKEADLEREAGLVRVSFGELSTPQSTWEALARSEITVRNRRSTRIFEVEIVGYTVRGEAVDPPIDKVIVLPSTVNVPQPSGFLPILVVESDQKISITLATPHGYLPDLVVIEYTDSAGRRWRVGSDGAVKRL